VLHYQAIARIATGEVEAAEALVRWRLADGSYLAPGRFIPEIENDPVFWRLTLHLIDGALAESARWAIAGYELAVAVNLSSATLCDDRLAGELAPLLARNGVPGSRLHLEVTEGAIMRDADAAARVLSGVRDLGVSVIAIDDFGTGYSSLARLRELPVNAVKPDRTFIAQLAATGDTTFLKPIIELAHGLGMSVTAEGIEHPESWSALAALGCDHAQGFWIARPAPPGVFMAWLREHRAEAYAALSQNLERRAGPGRRKSDHRAEPDARRAARQLHGRDLAVPDAGR
jgi:EAL domain-containing protein (putative c-di-GMP-specific phosphodiesterase class I)